MSTPTPTPLAASHAAAAGPAPASVHIPSSPALHYLLRIGDTCLVLGQRLGEWCGHGPVVEEDIALTNIALDLIGQARAVLTLAGKPLGLDEDQLAFLRNEHDYLNFTLAELPRGDFAFAVLRNLMLSSYFKVLWQKLLASTDTELAAIAGKALKEARYHQQHSADWLARLGGGTAESKARCETALKRLWPYHAELFESDAVDESAAASGLGPKATELYAPWLADMTEVMTEAGLSAPAASRFRSTSKTGVHSEHMGSLLAELQYLQRAYPGGVW